MIFNHPFSLIMPMTAILLLGGCVSNKPVINYSPEDIVALKISLEGEGTIQDGTFVDHINDLFWTCRESPPFKLHLSVNEGTAKLKLKGYGRIYRSTATVDDNGEIKNIIDMGRHGVVKTRYFIHSNIQLKRQRANITLNSGTNNLGGCPTGWFDLAEIKNTQSVN